MIPSNLPVARPEAVVGAIDMSSRRLKVTGIKVETQGAKNQEISVLTIAFSRKLTQLEVSGVRAVLDGEIK